MSERKQTPDILAEILGGGEPPEAPEAPARPPTRSPARSAQAITEAKTYPAPKRPALRAVDGQPDECWEHRVASFQEHRGWRLRYVDGVECDEWIHAATVCEYLAQISLEGWQVAGTCSGQALFGLLDRYQIYLKRRRKPATISAV